MKCKLEQVFYRNSSPTFWTITLCAIFGRNGYFMKSRPFLMTLHRFMACNSNIIGLETINDVIYNNLCLMFPPNIQETAASRRMCDGKKRGAEICSSLHCVRRLYYMVKTHPLPVCDAGCRRLARPSGICIRCKDKETKREERKKLIESDFALCIL